jgi:hypothetical protein
MGQIGPPKTAFSDADLAELEWVYQSVCSALETFDQSEKASLRRQLFLLACNGMNDPEMLRARLIEGFMRSKKSKRDAA